MLGRVNITRSTSLMTLKEFVSECIERLAPLYPGPEAKAIAFRLLEHYTDIPSYKFISEPNFVIPGLTRNLDTPLRFALDELAGGRPLQYVLGVTEFCGHRFKVKEGCLIPRPETEELVTRIINDMDVVIPGLTRNLEEEPFNILDMGTGSGCIAWSLAAAFPEAMVYGCDRSNDALTIACKQRVKVGGAKPIFFWADMLALPPAGLPPFDLIVSNPPYICEEERSAMRVNVLDFEPAEALFVPDDDPLLFYRAVARWADALLRPDGCIYLEVNERFGPAVAALFPGSRVLQDISGKDRFVVR